MVSSRYCISVFALLIQVLEAKRTTQQLHDVLGDHYDAGEEECCLVQKGKITGPSSIEATVSESSTSLELPSAYCSFRRHQRHGGTCEPYKASLGTHFVIEVHEITHVVGESRASCNAVPRCHGIEGWRHMLAKIGRDYSQKNDSSLTAPDKGSLEDMIDSFKADWHNTIDQIKVANGTKKSDELKMQSSEMQGLDFPTSFLSSLSSTYLKSSSMNGGVMLLLILLVVVATSAFYYFNKQIPEDVEAKPEPTKVVTEPLLTESALLLEPQCAVWLTPEECRACGMPPLGELMASYLHSPPWVWQTVDRWVRMPFPWDPMTLCKLCESKNITRRDDQNEHSMPSHLVEQFTHGKSIFGYERSHGDQTLDRITPVMCIRIFEPSGRCLVRASRLKQVEGREELKHLEAPEWPGRATGQPQDVIIEARGIALQLLQSTGASATISGALRISYGEIAMSEPTPDKYITVKTRYIRHFVNVVLSEPVPEEFKELLGLAEGHFTVVKNSETGESDTYEWWDTSKCDEKLPGNTAKALRSCFNATKGENHELEEGVNFEFHQATPWNVDVVEGVLRHNKVNTKPIRNLRNQMAESLHAEEWTLVHKMNPTDSEAPTIALVRSDGCTFFFHPKAKDRRVA